MKCWFVGREQLQHCNLTASVFLGVIAAVVTDPTDVDHAQLTNATVPIGNIHCDYIGASTQCPDVRTTSGVRTAVLYDCIRCLQKKNVALVAINAGLICFRFMFYLILLVAAAARSRRIPSYRIKWNSLRQSYRAERAAPPADSGCSL